MFSRRRVAVALTALALTGGVVVTTEVAEAAKPFEVTAVSNPHPDLVSGGDVLIRVQVPDNVKAQHVTIERNGQDVTSAFRLQPDGSWLGLVTGLVDGDNTIVARGNANGRGVPTGLSGSLKVVNHPVTGPVFSGPQQLPFFCETTAFGLGPSTPPNCEAATQVAFLYRTTTGQFLALADPTAVPANAEMLTIGGRTVPYIVRLERGTIDRAVYELAALYDGQSPNPLQPTSTWNQRLVYTFGGGCNGGYHQGAGTGGVVNDLFLRRGYLVASSSLNVLDNNCSTIISAEAAMMVKEHAIETYGPVLHTIGWGGSGGAIQQYDIADQYPGILDGIIPGVSFPDPFSTTGPVVDCRLLNTYFATSGVAFTDAQKQAVMGFRTTNVCFSWQVTFANRSTATGSCPAIIPPAVRWNEVTNPDGVRCSAAEQVANQLGRDPATGFVRGVFDNIGVQYGLAALEAGQISAEQFVSLNEHIGGIDYKGDLSAGRSVADPIGLAAAYRTDLVNSGGQGLRTTPVIDQRTYVDNIPTGFADIHTSEWSYVMRARMQRAGVGANQVIIENNALQGGIVNGFELDAMDRWLTAIGSDSSARSLEEKVAANRPADLTDGCLRPDGTFVAQELTLPSSGECGALYPIFTNTRLAAGEPLTRDWLKCDLRPLNLADYPVTFTPDQQARLMAAFAGGVCDYSLPAVQQQPPAGAWLVY